MERFKNWIIGGVIVVILIVPIIVNYIKSRNIETINFSKYNEAVTSQNFSLIYVGDLTEDKFSTKETDLLELRNKHDVTINAISKEELSQEAWATIKNMNSNITENAYVFIEEGSIVYADTDLSKEKIDVLINKYYNDIIPEDEIAYKTFSNYKDFMSVVDSKKVTMIVLGRDTCSWCNKFKPIYNAAAAEYNINIYYINTDTFNSNELSKILNSGLIIPAKCSDTKADTPLSSGFSTPLSLFTKKGEVIDCISGYTNKDGLDTSLKAVGLIK